MVSDNEGPQPDPSQPLPDPDHEYAAQVVARFRNVWENLGGIDELLEKKYGPTEDEQSQVTIEMTADRIAGMFVYARVRLIREQVMDLHHKLGHLLVGECWKDVEVGEEFEERNDNSIAGMLAKALGANVVDFEAMLKAQESQKNN